jgi:hypothetical protein
MAWNSKSKDLDLTKIVPHANSDPKVTGRAPSISTITFSPMQLYGAAARCSHLHVVNPATVTPESLIISALLEQHVDDVSNDFAILSSADTFKDFVKSYFAGTVAAGVAYLAMINDGYVWSDHFENLGGGSSGTKKTPDFVFAGPASSVALMESKGSRSATSSAFDTRISDGYIDQVEPHLGHVVGTATATHGYCIGSYLQSTTKAELRVHHTAVPVAGGGGGAGDPTSISAVQRHNYATAFRLAHSELLSEQLRSGDGPDRIPFLRFHWRGRKWLTAYSLSAISYPPGYPSYLAEKIKRSMSDIRLGPSLGFALEETIAVDVLNSFLRGGRREGDPLEIAPLSLDGEPTYRGTPGGAIFPDGLAIVSGKANWPLMEAAMWELSTGQLS